MSYVNQRSFGSVTLLQFKHLEFMSTTVKKDMPVGIFSKYYILLISLLIVVPVYSKDIQCRAIDKHSVPSLLLPDRYSTNVEVKLMHEKMALLIREDRTDGITSLKVTNNSHVVHCLYHYRQKQLVTVTEDLREKKVLECRMDPLALKTPCIPNSPWTIPLHELRHSSNFSWFPDKKEYPRDIECLHLELCEYDANNRVSMRLDSYIAVNWELPRSNAMINLIRLNFTLPNARVVSDYIDFFTNTKDPDDFLLPHGTFCPGLNISNLKPPRIDQTFSVNTEIADLDEIKNERLIFDPKKKLVLLETESKNVSSGAKRVIYDYNTGYKYTISLRTGKCQTTEKIHFGDFFVKGCLGKNNCEMSNPDDYFHADKADIQYVGKRKVRGIMCDVWVGKYQDIYESAVNTIEWYYIPKTWAEIIGTKHEDSIILRMDIWEPGTETPSIHNFFDFDTNPKVWSQFDISPCYSKPDENIRFTIKLKANGRKDLLPYTTDNYAVQHFQEELSSLEGISPILFSQTMVDYDMNQSVVYFTTTLLSGPKKSNPKFANKDFKAMKDVFESISERVKSKKWKISLSIQLGSKSLNLTADEIWRSAAEGDINLSTTPSLSTTEKTSQSQHTSTVGTTTKQTHSSISTAAISTTGAPWTLSSSDKPSTEPAEQTKITVATSAGTTTANPTNSSSTSPNGVSTIIQTSSLSTNYVTSLLTKRTRTTHRISSTIFSHSPTPLQQTTGSSSQATAAKPTQKGSSTSGVTECACSTVSTKIPGNAESFHNHENYSTSTLIGFVCGSFVVGMLFAFVIVSFHSVFCRRKTPNGTSSELHILSDTAYSELE